MSLSIRQLLVTGFLLMLTSDNIFAQLRNEVVEGDTLLIFTQPMRDRFTEKVTARVSKTDSIFKYEFEIGNEPESRQSIWLWLFISEASFFDPLVPNGWRLINRGNPTRINWGAQSEEAQIGPSEVLKSFGFHTSSLPTIKNYYMEGWAQFILEEEPDSVENSSFFDVVKKGTTIFPRVIPIQSQTEQIYTLKTYLKRSCEELGWITNKGTCNSLEVKLRNVHKHLENEKPKQAANVLGAFLNEVEAQKDKALTSEAYALLFFNGEYLLKKLEE